MHTHKNNFYLEFTTVLLILSTISSISPAQVSGQEILTLPKAEQIAIDLDPVAQAYMARAQAYREEAVAEGQLPDPRLKLATMNLPVDSFDRSREAMTQLQIGIQQSFPRGQTLRYKQEFAEALADVETARELERVLVVLRDVRIRYLELFYQTRSESILQQNRSLFAELLDTTQRQYAQGRDNQHDVLRAQLELSLIDDRILEVLRAKESARGDLARYLTIDRSIFPIAETFPVLQELPSVELIREGLNTHPLIRIEDAAVQASRKKINEVEEQYKPGFSVDLTYGNRAGDAAGGMGRPDMLSAMLTIDLPLFTGKRQDRRLAAATQQRLARQYVRTDRLYELDSMLEREYANWQRLDERYLLYEQRAISDARLNVESTLNAYQSDIADFTTLMRAQLIELNTQLDMLRIRIERNKAHARLLYLAGGK